MRQNNTANMNSPNNTSKRGFGSMDQERQREIASMGGKAAHASGNAHQFNSAEAREAGRRGGEARRENINQNKKQSVNRVTM